MFGCQVLQVLPGQAAPELRRAGRPEEHLHTLRPRGKLAYHGDTHRRNFLLVKWKKTQKKTTDLGT